MFPQHFCIVACFCAGTYCSNLQAATVTAVEDTMLTAIDNPAGGFLGPSGVHGNEDDLWLIGGPFVTDDFTTPLLKFDLSPFTGSVITSDVELRLQVLRTFNGSPVTHSNVRIHRVLSNWQEDTLSLNSFGPSSGWQPAIDYETAAFSSLSPVTAGPGDQVSFLLSPSVVQSWIDDPASNHGIIIISDTASAQNISFRSNNFATGAPVLVSDQLTAVPEPSALVALSAGILIAGTSRKRRKSRSSSAK